MKLDIRPLQSADVEAVHDLERKCAGAAHWKMEVYQQLAEPMAARGVRKVTLVAERERRVVGFVAGRVFLDEAELENIVVDPLLRRQGIAQALLDGFLARCSAAGAAVLRLEVRESNAAARGFYGRAGFVQESRRPGYYQMPDEAALVFALKL